jgi:O-antigen biosynthesis protein
VMDFMAMGGRTNMRYTKLDTNHGICTALNVGYAMAAGNDVVRMDNDVEIVTDDWLDRFIETAYSDDDVGIVHCCPVLDDESIHAFEIKVIAADAMDPQPGTPHDPVVHNRTLEVETAWLMCAFIKSEVVAACTNDEAYNPVWFEDIDYCLQARQAGFRVLCNQRIKVRHHHAIRNRKEMFARCERESTADRNRAYMQDKWWKLRVPVAGPGWKDGDGLGPDYQGIARQYQDCPQITKFLDPAYR